MKRRKRKPVWRDQRRLELAVLGAVHTWPDSTRQELATALACDMQELLEPLWALIHKGYITRRTDPTVTGRYNPVVPRETED